MKWWVLGIACAVGLAIALMSSLIKGFWKSLWEDFSGAVKKHWLRLIGAGIFYFGPFLFFVCAYMTVTRSSGESTKITMPFFVWLVGIPALIIYWFKLRKALEAKLIQMKSVNEVQEGKHYALLCASEVLQQAMSVATIAMVYCVVSFMESIFSQASTGVLVFLVCGCLGAVFFVLDATFSYAEGDEPKKKDIEIVVKGEDNKDVGKQ